MKRILDRTIVALSLVGLTYFVAADLRAWIEGSEPVEVACSR